MGLIYYLEFFVAIIIFIIAFGFSYDFVRNTVNKIAKTEYIPEMWSSLIDWRIAVPFMVLAIVEVELIEGLIFYPVIFLTILSLALIVNTVFEPESIDSTSESL